MILYISLGAAAFILLAALFSYFSNNCLQITEYTLVTKDIDEGVKIVHLSDLHGKCFGKGNARLIKKVAAQKPGFIAVTGDIIHIYTAADREAAIGLVNSLKEIAPVLYIAGNHEMRNKGYRFLRKDLKEAGAIVLDDCSRDICGVTVTGLNGASLRNDKIFGITPDGGFKILLAHEPQFIEKYASAGYDLALCGHAHGGQWRIPFTGRGLYAPGQGKFPKYTQGVHECGKMKMIISRGLGNSEFPLRLFNRPEIVVINLKPDGKTQNELQR